MPAVCQSLVIANLYAIVGVAVLQTAYIRAGLAAQSFCEHAVFISHVCTGVGVLHVVAPGVHGGGCCASYALHNKGFVVAFQNLVAAVKNIFTFTSSFIPLHRASDFLACTRRSQAISNLYLTSQIIAVIRIICVSKFLSQCTQNLFDIRLAVHVDVARVVSRQDYTRACCCTINNSVARGIIVYVRTIAIMRVEDICPAAVVVNSPVSRQIHVDLTSLTLSFATVYSQVTCSRTCTIC